MGPNANTGTLEKWVWSSEHICQKRPNVVSKETYHAEWVGYPPLGYPAITVQEGGGRKQGLTSVRRRWSRRI